MIIFSGKPKICCEVSKLPRSLFKRLLNHSSKEKVFGLKFWRSSQTRLWSANSFCRRRKMNATKDRKINCHHYFLSSPVSSLCTFSDMLSSCLPTTEEKGMWMFSLFEKRMSEESRGKDTHKVLPFSWDDYLILLLFHIWF